MISPDIDSFKQRKSLADIDDSSKDDISTNSSSSKTMKKRTPSEVQEKDYSPYERAQTCAVIKRITEKKEVKKEDDDIEKIIQKIENEHINTLHDMGNRITSLEY